MLRISLALGALAGIAMSARADVYKSVDAQGQVHYSDQWSPGAEMIKGERPHGTPFDTPAPVSNPSAPDPTRSAARQVQADVQTARTEQCKALKEQYDKLIHARHVYQPKTDSSAPPQVMSDAEADAERVRTRQAMDEACADGTSS
jgi:Domain of unknown function (DUF4124)